MSTENTNNAATTTDTVKPGNSAPGRLILKMQATATNPKTGHNVQVAPEVFRYAKAITDRLNGQPWSTDTYHSLALAILMWLRNHQFNLPEHSIDVYWFGEGVNLDAPTDVEVLQALTERSTTILELIKGFDAMQAGELSEAEVRALFEHFGKVAIGLAY